VLMDVLLTEPELALNSRIYARSSPVLLARKEVISPGPRQNPHHKCGQTLNRSSGHVNDIPGPFPPHPIDINSEPASIAAIPLLLQRSTQRDRKSPF
jgi:hypothetical protein